MPIVFSGLGNLLFPLLLSTPEVLYPRLNNLSLLLFWFGWIIAASLVVLEYGIGLGWTLYVPLSSVNVMLNSITTDTFVFTLVVLGTSSSLSSPPYSHPTF